MDDPPPTRPLQMVAEKHTLGDYKQFTKAKGYHDFIGIIKHTLGEEMEKTPSLGYRFYSLVKETDEHNQIKQL